MIDGRVGKAMMWALSTVISNFAARVKLLCLREQFSTFGQFWTSLGQFGPFFGAHFPSLPTFTVSPHGILANEIAP
jgi:hypothetical protein